MPKRVETPEDKPMGLRKKKRKAYKAPRKERCQICKLLMEGVSASHLREHGWSVGRYQRVYGGTRPLLRSSVRIPSSHDDDLNDVSGRDIISEVAEHLTSSKQWVNCIADEVGERILGGPLRQRLSALLTTMLFQRAAVHGKALAILTGSLDELQAEWRLTQGGDNGEPTDTDTIIRIVEKTAKIVKDSEDAVQRTIKLALDEQRLAADTADALGPALYQGTGEALNMPAGMTTGDRETIRNLLSLVGKTANEEGTIDATSQVIARDIVPTPTPLPPSPPPPLSRSGDDIASSAEDIASAITCEEHRESSEDGGTPPPPGAPLAMSSGDRQRPPRTGDDDGGTPRDADDAIHFSETMNTHTSLVDKKLDQDSETMEGHTSSVDEEPEEPAQLPRASAMKKGALMDELGERGVSWEVTAPMPVPALKVLLNKERGKEAAAAKRVRLKRLETRLTGEADARAAKIAKTSSLDDKKAARKRDARVKKKKIVPRKKRDVTPKGLKVTRVKRKKDTSSGDDK